MVVVYLKSVERGKRFKVFLTKSEARKINRRRAYTREELYQTYGEWRVYEEYDHPHQYYVLRYDFCPICDGR
ncbi:hypothetical protein DRO54_08735 [Candidatus Bathyarchaeota archaeon]|nr:MAG: hypothetical protein DRO54_08735 [Candidatus Bathyarchaeota archaeon]